MRLINSAEFDSLAAKGRGRASQVFNAIINLNVGEAVVIDKSEWKKRYPLSRRVTYVAKKYKRKFNCIQLLNNEGWAVKRLE